MNEQQNENEAACGGSALTAVLGGEPTPEQFVLVQANIAMRTLVDYEAQYKCSPPEEVQQRIIGLADFIKAQLEKSAA
jgi:hypothetical protein